MNKFIPSFFQCILLGIVILATACQSEKLPNGTFIRQDATPETFIGLEVKDDTNHDNPERTGRMVCVRGEALPKVKSPINYIEHKAFDQLFSEALKDK